MKTLFDFFDTLFSPVKYRDNLNSEKKRHFFMCQRFFSIKFTDEANSFNINGINQVAAMDFWHKVLAMKYSQKPHWVYTKTKKNEKKDKLDKISADTIKYYIKVNRMKDLDFKFMCNIYPEEMYKKLKHLESLILSNL